ncbi:MAG TPA: TolC family protein [Gemmataceae bacterium]|nr:TolC family protein [Gemmataceae bacterium]
MTKRPRSVLLSASLISFCLMGPAVETSPGQESQKQVSPAPAGQPSVAHLTLDEVKARILADNKLLQLVARNIRSKEYATRAMQANYFPQIIGQSVYMHFNDDLGTVLSAGGRTITGPLGRPLITFPATAVNVAVVNQDSAVNTIAAVQPITDLLKVRQGVKVARADEQIAQAQMEKATRELLSGVEQLFWGILVAQKIQAGAQIAVGGAEELAKTKLPEARIALVEAKQGLQEVSSQLAGLQVQLAILLDMPTCTKFELVEPPLPLAPVKCGEDAVAIALANSPDIREAQQNVCKARAGVAVAKVDYYPNIAVVGGYTNQTFADYIQPNIGYVGAIGSYTFVDWGKRRNKLREAEEVVGMAVLKCQQTQDDVRQKTLKAFQDYESSAEALNLAGEMLAARQEAAKAATALTDRFKTAKDLATAQVDAVKADLNHRIDYVKLMSLIGQ